MWWAENEPVSDGGNPPRPIRLFRMAEHSTPDLFASRVPVHSVLVQKSVTTITNLAGRLPPWMLGNREHFRKRKMQNSWQEACWQLCSCGDGRLARPSRAQLGSCLRRLQLGFAMEHEPQITIEVTDRLQPVRLVSCKTSSSALASLLARCRASGEGFSSCRFSR